LLSSLNHCCYVIAPSLISKQSGEKIKTDKRDALKLTKLLKSEDLTPIYVPEPADEAVRDLSRARETGIKDLKDAKYQLKALLLPNTIPCLKGFLIPAEAYIMKSRGFRGFQKV
jgi:transposase